MQPLHEIRVLHRFQKTVSEESNESKSGSVEQCKDCGVERRVLHLNTAPQSSWETASREELSALFNKYLELCKNMAEVCNGEIRTILHDSKYEDIHALVNDINRRYEGHVDAASMQFTQLSQWVSAKTPKFRRKNLLAYKQGLVCNRCDELCPYHLLTVDEVEAKGSGGQAKLPNSQLLCEKCHRSKNRSGSDDRDISAFECQRRPCIHEIYCVQLNEQS